MGNGDDALAAGMDVVSETADVRLGYDEINKSRDYIAQRTSAVTAISKGGTGATTAAAARSNLGIIAKNVPSTGSNVQADIDYLNSIKANKSDLNNISVNAANVSAGTFPGGAFTYPGQIWCNTIMLPGATAATSSYTVAYINGDGRLSKGASTRRLKKDIVRNPELPDLFAVPLAEFTMRADKTGERHFGHIAEDLADNPATEPFVVYDEKGLPASFDMLGFLFARVELLNRRITELGG